MKVKEIDRTANIAWSPAAQHPIYLAAGTAAQQLDATFSTSASLEIYGLNLTEPGLDMTLKGTVPSDFRFHKIVWGGYNTEDKHPSGVIVAGTDSGGIVMYDPAKCISGESTDPIMSQEKHTGPVRALDFNPFQNNLLASGASDSGIYVWDLNNPNTPMTPGVKSQPPDDVSCVSWNRQVQHILASTFPARCVVWDLRKNEPIIKVSDSTSRIRCKMVAWHPEVATQLCLASEDDQMPVIQLWDLRFATSPLKVLEGHQRGVLSIAWCPQDPDLLLSCGKDSRLLVWNPNSSVPGEQIVCELPTSSQWSFDVGWCPRNPAVIAAASFDGHVGVYSLMGGQQQFQTSSKIAESFPGAEMTTEAHRPEHRSVPIPLKKPPKWLRRPVGASFAFGGKLVTFENNKPAPSGPGAPAPVARQVHISQVLTEPNLVSRSADLENALNSGQFSDFCENRVGSCKQPHEAFLWRFLKASFDRDFRTSYLTLLGYDVDETCAKLRDVIGESSPADKEAELIARQMAGMTTSSNESRRSPALAANRSQTAQSDGSVDGTSMFEMIASSHSSSRTSPAFSIQTKDDTDGLISQALLVGSIRSAVSIAFSENRMADALILAMMVGDEVLEYAQERYFQLSKSPVTKLIQAVVTHNFDYLVKSCDLDSWKEVMAAIITHASMEDVTRLSEVLGQRLEEERDGELVPDAMLCYICAGNLDRIVDCWHKLRPDTSKPTEIQDLVEIVSILQQAARMHQLQASPQGDGPLVKTLQEYAFMLSSQGCLESALSYISAVDQVSDGVLKDRLYRACGKVIPGLQAPAFPFKYVDVRPEGAVIAPAPVQPKQQQQQQVRGGYSSGYQYQAGDYGALPQQHAPAAPTSYQPTPSNFYDPTPRVPGYGYGPSAFQPPQQPPRSETPTQVQRRGSGHKYPQDPSTSNTNMYGQIANVPPAPFQQPSYGGSTMGGGMAGSPYAVPPGPAAPQTTPFQPQPFNPQIYQPQAAPPPPAPVARPPHAEPNPGWNDPPSSLKLNSKPVPDNYEPPAPITRPLFSLPASETLPPQGMPGQMNYYQPQLQQPVPQQPQQMYQHPTSMMYNQQPPEPQHEEPQRQRRISTPKPKAPIPAEHLVLQEVFDGIKDRCVTTATNPQVRRKLDDVSKKLEALYDKLRENGLSQGPILGLHQMVQCVNQRDYQGALQVHTHVVSTSTFSEISAFMPGLKVLFQTANQLGV